MTRVHTAQFEDSDTSLDGLNLPDYTDVISSICSYSSLRIKNDYEEMDNAIYIFQFQCQQAIPKAGQVIWTINDGFDTKGGEIYPSTCMMGYGGDLIPARNIECSLDGVAKNTLLIKGFAEDIPANTKVEFTVKAKNPTTASFGYELVTYKLTDKTQELGKVTVLSTDATNLVIKVKEDAATATFSSLSIGDYAGALMTYPKSVIFYAGATEDVTTAPFEITVNHSDASESIQSLIIKIYTDLDKPSKAAAANSAPLRCVWVTDIANNV